MYVTLSMYFLGNMIWQVSCMVSRGKYEHQVISLVEDPDQKGAKWVHKGNGLPDIALVEAAAGVLRDVHVSAPAWLGGNSSA
jgi:hypothetical protein